MLLVSESLFFEEARTPQDLHSAEHEHNMHEQGAPNLIHLIHPASHYQTASPIVQAAH